MKKILSAIIISGLFVFGTVCLVNSQEAEQTTPILNNEKKLSFQETLKKANSGDISAQYSLGMMYYDGVVVAQDLKAAIKWFTEAAERGSIFAQNKLGEMYYRGEGVTQDHKEAIKWYSIAAELGYAEAQYNLGYMYFSDNAITQDYLHALMWSYIASAHATNNEIRKKAVDLSNEIALKMSKNQILEAQKLAKEWTEKKEQSKIVTPLF